ncbi:MAG: GNAT family N-acetyltransferase [Candidatus Anstonellales archaeon]
MIRALKKGEKEKIKPLILQVFPDAEFSIKNSDQIFVYEKNSTISAFAHLRKYSYGIVLLGFGVLENFRSQGIGRHLLSFVVNFAEKSHQPLYLKVKKGNRAAVSLYKSFGFKITKSKGDRFVMKRACFS